MNEVFYTKEKELSTDTCKKCKLHLFCKSPKHKVIGQGAKHILVVLEAPGLQEDLYSSTGKTLLYLEQKFAKYDIDLYKDCWITFGVSCRPSRKSRKPTKREVKCCSKILAKRILKLKPSLVFLMGEIALYSFLDDRLGNAIGGIKKWRGFTIPDQRYKTWVIATYHPMHIKRTEYKMEKKILSKIFSTDIKRGLKKQKKKVPLYKKYKVNIINEDDAIAELCYIHQNNPVKLIAFDYETTGLKPYTKGHEIVCCGISYKKNQASAFLMTDKLKKYCKMILADKYISKTAHNIKFEHLWSKIILKTKVRGWKWDSMIAAHQIDNRTGITGLKFQAYINFGQEDYSSHLNKYIKTDGEDEFNKVKEAPQQELLHYCGMDALLQFKLAVKQMKELK